MNKKIIFKFLSLLSILMLYACGEPKSSVDTAKLKRTSLIASTGKLWKNKSTIIVTFFDGNAEVKAEVERFANEWTKYANLTFEFYPNLKSIPRNKIADITITFNTDVHTSAVGTDAKHLEKSTASMNLGILSDKNINTRRSIILHEFGHAIGLEHEHQHKSRTIEFDEAKTIVACQKHIGFTEEMCRSFILKKFSSENMYFSSYDLLSIMHYTLHSDFFKTKLQMKSNLSLSLIDKIEIGKLYPGKMTRDQIIFEHEKQQLEIKELKTYKNCQLSENAEEQMRPTSRGIELTAIKFYTIESVRPNDFLDNSMWEDKESTIIRMQTLEYCNLSEDEINARSVKKKAEQYANRIYNSCYISVNEDGLPTNKSGCPVDFQFQVLDLKKNKSIDNLCHQNFDAALDAMKKLSACKR